MNRKQLQLEVCKALLDSNKRCYGAAINEKEFAVTTTGYDVFIFDVNECIFDISKIRTSDVLAKVCEDNEKDECIRKTGHLFADHGKIIEKYENEKIIVYVNSEFSKKFFQSGVDFFANSSEGRILVKDQLGRKIGAFLPMRFDEKEVK
jgi:hypothetical protein